VEPGNSDGLIFASETGEPLDRRTVTKLEFKPLLKQAGLPEIQFHDHGIPAPHFYSPAT
jgi:hypothetical protein